MAIYDDKKEKYILFATNKEAESTEKFEKAIPEEYKKRWNIETGYRVKNDFKIRTCTKSPVARVLFLVIQCIMYNVLSMLKSVIEITAYELKSLINEDINKAVRYSPLSADVLTIFTMFLAIVFSENLLGYSNTFFKISHDFRSFAFIENFQPPFSEASVDILTAEFRIILQKR